mmetsp:Transcript_48077/g.56174  ORF Transcript_48077/g.56174 Transcript_48077/m.56174 type:complete len:110 (+) Transcript_48077:930-1259(+)
MSILMHLHKHDKENAEEDSVKQIASLTQNIKTMHMVLTDIEKIMRNDPLLDVSLMNDFSTKVLLRLYEPSYGIFGKPVLRKDMIGSGENYSDSNESTVQEPSLYSRLNK